MPEHGEYEAEREAPIRWNAADCRQHLAEEAVAPDSELVTSAQSLRCTA
jgi:hypothetical protein